MTSWQTVDDVLNHHRDLDFAPIQSFHKTSQFMMMYHQTISGCKRISSSKGTGEMILFFIISAHTVTLTLNITKPFCTTPWFMMMHHHTKSGYKNLNRSDHPTKHSSKFCTFNVTLTLKMGKRYFHTALQLTITDHQTKSGHKRISSSDEMIGTAMLWTYDPCDHDLEDSKLSVLWHSGLWRCITVWLQKIQWFRG